MANPQPAVSQFQGSSPGPPFHMTNISNIDLNTQNTGFVPTQPSPNAGISQAKSTPSQDFTTAGFNFTDGNDMDISGDRSVDQPSPATISSQSRGGSTSHSSYSPGQANEHNLPYRASPKFFPGQMVTAGATVFPEPGFTSSSEMYANAFSTSGNMNDDIFHQHFPGQDDWEFNAMNTGTGMTPMADAAAWDSMLESVTMGWEGVGPAHPNTKFNAR